MNLIDRREALQRVAMLMGGSLSAPTLFALLEGCQPKTQEQEKSAAQKATITDNHRKMMAEISEIIIPTTNTPGAKAAGVPEFIAVVMTDCYTEKDREHFLTGLDQLDEEAKKTYKKGFLECQENERVALLKKAESDVVALREKKRQERQNKPANAEEADELLFFPTIKELTVVGYFTSEIGATQALEYVLVPGRYEGCVPLKPGQKSWAML